MDKKLTARRVSSEEWEARIGAQIKRARLDQDWSQAHLASLANIGLGSVKNLESGRGSSLKTLVRVVRALGLTEWLEDLNPTPEISPMAMLRAKQQSAGPQRASRKMKVLGDV